MKLFDYLLFGGTVAFFIIGVYEAIVLGIAQAYIYFMLSLSFLFLFSYRKNRHGREK